MCKKYVDFVSSTVNLKKMPIIKNRVYVMYTFWRESTLYSLKATAVNINVNRSAILRASIMQLVRWKLSVSSIASRSSFTAQKPD